MKRMLKEVYAWILFLILGVTYFLFSDPGENQPLLKFSRPLDCLPSKNCKVSVPRDELDVALAAASTGSNMTVIITIANKAYVEGVKPMLDLFLDSFWLGEGTRELINHLLIVAMDQASYDRCKLLRLHCYKLETEGVDFMAEKLYMSEDFIKMMWRRTLFLGDVLKRGYNFVFTDTDILWLRNPFQYLSPDQNLDLQISTDWFNGNEWNQSNPLNTGFYNIRSNKKTVTLFDLWYSLKDNSTGLKEQDVFNILMQEGIFKMLGIRVRFLDTVHFSGFCEDSRNPSLVATVHSNCCRRIAAKLSDLTVVIRDFRRYEGMSEDERLTFKWTNHTACKASWKNH